MKRIRQWVDRLSVKKKLVFYGYLTITPVLVLICVAMVINNYKKECAKRLENDLTSVNTLSESFGILQTDIKDFSTYICIRHSYLTAVLWIHWLLYLQRVLGLFPTSQPLHYVRLCISQKSIDLFWY